MVEAVFARQLRAGGSPRPTAPRTPPLFLFMGRVYFLMGTGGPYQPLLFTHLSRDLSRGHPRGLSASDDCGTGKPSAESLDKLPPR
jgi:hypothetical protein